MTDFRTPPQSPDHDPDHDPARVPSAAAPEAEAADKYDRMLRLADLLQVVGGELAERARLGDDVLQDPSVAESGELAPTTLARAESDVRAATTGPDALPARSADLEADALMVRSTVLTYRWIDDLQDAAHQTLGRIAGQAIGYLAPEVALGGAVVSAGLIETDALDRDGVVDYLDELAENNPELMDHVTSGGGGLLDGLRMRSLLTRRDPAPTEGGDTAGDPGPGLATDFGAALRDVAGGFVEPAPEPPEARAEPSTAPAGIEDLMRALAAAPAGVHVRRVAEQRYIAFLTGPDSGTGRRLRLVGGDHTTYAAQVVRAIERAVADEPGARVMLVGAGQGGVTAAEVAASAPSPAFVVDQVVTAGAPSAQVPRIPATTRVLSLEDRADPVAALGSLINAGSTNRVTVVFDSGRSGGAEAYVAGGRAADHARHPELQAELERLRAVGYLSA